MTSTFYRIQHTTTYKYASPVRVSHNQVMLTPRSVQGSSVEKHRLTVTPHPQEFFKREDFFGNAIHAFSIEDDHRSLTVTATAKVEVVSSGLSPDMPSPAFEDVIAGVCDMSDPRWLDATQFRYASRRIAPGLDYKKYALTSFTPRRPILEAGFEFTQRIFTDFAYDTSATDVNTPTAVSFEKRRGVCQDFAHVQIACLRSLGLPCRYVSGYLRTEPPAGQPRLVGADQSHAWVSLYCGPDLGWIDFDPTNKCLAGDGHITLAYGRDYEDVVPIRGVFLGGGNHTISVSVDVAPIQ